MKQRIAKYVFVKIYNTFQVCANTQKYVALHPFRALVAIFLDYSPVSVAFVLN